ncbi:molybdopterin-guanine dinucleotide biosynthesis protein B [Cupriavidus respiraculi]|uniref:Molybdopterin-guanine dinucleotide biosynthesis protein B (MobB) domain-containing protein n=1 Tax=Cupriavidus respiraculi TaxID=195930 RepID=A0ABM8X4I7_9BURK|nr:hypothetical protein LMG21510_02716 [Cupriavidus respiraculi]
MAPVAAVRAASRLLCYRRQFWRDNPWTIVKVFGIAGSSGSGKTTLLDRLIPRLVGAGLRVAGIKHTHHGFDPDTPGKDSWRMREAGCANVVLVGESHLTLMRRYPADTPPTLSDALALLPRDTDLVLVEGYKRSDFPKLEIYRPAHGKPPLWPEFPGIVAVATDAPEELAQRTALPVLDLADIDALSALVRRTVNL